MWLLPERRPYPTATIHQFAAYRIVLGVVIVVSLGAASVPDAPAESWLELPRVLRGSLRLIVVVAGLCLMVGFLRRIAAGTVLALGAFLAAHEYVSWPLVGPLIAHCALVAFPSGREPWSLSPGASTRTLSDHFSPAAWLICGATCTLLALDVEPRQLGIALIVLAWLAIGTAMVLGPRLPLAAGTFGVFVLAACLSSEPAASLLILVPALLACISEDWLPSKHDSREEPIVFFDGVCGLCQSSVQLIIAEDVLGRMRFAALQGQTSERLLNLPKTGKYDTMVLHEDGARLEHSDAALRIADILGGFWRLAQIISWLPEGWRDHLYSVVAESRYDWFGKLDACPVPTPEQRARFLD